MLTILGFPWLETLSAVALAGSLLIYVLLDGTDLGAGILRFSAQPTGTAGY